MSRTKIAIVAVAIAALVAGCSSNSKGPASSTAQSSAAKLSPVAIGTLLESVAIKNTDVASGYSVALVPNGDQLTGQVSLDNCGFNFSTESDRVARRQYEVATSTGTGTGIFNEIVAYASPADATLALTQWHQSVTTCPKTPVQSKVAGEPATTVIVADEQYEVAGSLPNPANDETVESLTAQGQTDYLIAVQQIHGRYLDSVYINQSTQPTQDSLNAASQLAVVTGTRLAAEPAS